jgi:glycosyltransferase involved in cell wall biosynthesis
MPTVSILLTCYNHIRFLPAAYDGILTQTFEDYEIIAIDDGSTDGTREWLASREEPITCLFNERNLGTYASLNVGLERARGEFVAVLNDDDLWAPEKLEKQLALMHEYPRVGLVHTGGHFIDGDGRRTEGNPLGFRFPTFKTGDLLLGLVYENKIIASAALARKSCFDELGGFNSSYFGSGDWEMWFRIAERYDVGFVDEPLTFYRVHGANASHKLERIWQDDERLREFIQERLDLHHGAGRLREQEYRTATAFNQAALGTVKKLNGRTGESRAAYRRSIRHDPKRWRSYLRFAATFLPQSIFRKLL